MTNEQPEQWAVELAAKLGPMLRRYNEPAATLTIQRAFTERTADLVADNAKLRDALVKLAKYTDYLPHPHCLDAQQVIRQALAQQDTTDAK